MREIARSLGSRAALLGCLAIGVTLVAGGGSATVSARAVSGASSASDPHDEHRHDLDRHLPGDPDASKPDSDAPRGAPSEWLPNEDWVMQHWLPYRERHLLRILDSNRHELTVSIRRRPLAGLARAKGMSPRKVLRRVMAPVRREYPRRYRLLYRRARRTFTQRHLMQHMVFHPLHHVKWQKYITETLDLGWLTIHALRDEGHTLMDIARMQGLDSKEFLRGGIATIRRAAMRGVRRGELPRAQAKDYIREVRAYAAVLWPDA